MDAFLGEIRIFGGNFAPVGWALCQGQLLSIAQNTALFSILGTTYGGNGIETFGLPDLRSRVPLGWGQGPGLTLYNEGDTGGVESVALTDAQLPAHTHTAAGSSQARTTSSPSGAVPAGGGYYTAAPNVSLSPSAIGATGGNQPHENRQPFLALNFIIALQGIFPSRS